MSEVRIKRLRIRSWRRGTKEMDLLLGTFADAHLASLSPSELDCFEAMLEENDHDLYAWAAGRAVPPEVFSALIARIVRDASEILRQDRRML